MTDLSREGADLAEVSRRVRRYVAHAGYTFVDKPQERTVELIPATIGILVRHRVGASATTVQALLQAAGLLERARDSDERLLVCRWDIPIDERPGRLRALKQSAAVETVAPFLEDHMGQVRIPYPDRLDLALIEAVDTAHWEQLLDRFGLTLVQRFAPDYGSARVQAHPHDLGALYRTLRALANEPIVRFVEPTYLVVEDS
jgi:hypothetical protein